MNDAENAREADEAKKAGVQVKNDAENLCYTVEKQMTDLKEKMTEGDKTDLQEKMKALRTALTGAEGGEADLEAIKEKHKDQLLLHLKVYI